MAKWMARRRRLAIAVGVVVVLSSNCSLSRGRTQLVHVTSTPPTAQVSLNGESVGETPVHVEVRRRDAEPVLRIEKAGFGSVEKRLDRRLSRRFIWGDLVVALLLGGVAWAGASIDSGGYGPESIGFGALWSTAVLAPPLALGSAFEFPTEVDVALRRSNGGVGSVAAAAGESVRPMVGGRSWPLRVRGELADRSEGGEGAGVRGRPWTERIGRAAERSRPPELGAEEGR